MAEKVLLKDILFNTPKVEQMAGEIHRAYPSFNAAVFVRDVVSNFPKLELKARIGWIAECLRRFLTEDYEQAVRIILRSLPLPNNPNLSDDDFGDFIYAPYGEYVARYGCSQKNLKLSLSALHEITQRFSTENAMRYFLNAFPKETLKELLPWSKDSHYHVRRLASEGTRPKLPWSQKINIPITAPLAILDNLFFDNTRFVTRSVANHVNDISKIDPDLALRTLARWRESGKQKPEEMDYIMRHALRTLVKQGNPEAMKLLGCSHTPRVSMLKFSVPKEVAMNTALEFSLTVQSKEHANLILDYVLSFQNKAGKLNGRKVFKIKNTSLAKGQVVTIAKRHPLREHMTTRKLFRGRHEIEVQINGKSYGKKPFWIV